jgi:hypothetical protein
MRVFMAACVLVLAGCSVRSETEPAERAVTTFRQQLDAARYDDIYLAAGDELKAREGRPGFVALLHAVHHRLGDARSQNKESWMVNYQPGVRMVTLHYTTNYARGAANEQFTYRIDRGGARLVGYHINAPALQAKSIRWRLPLEP